MHAGQGESDAASIRTQSSPVELHLELRKWFTDQAILFASQAIDVCGHFPLYFAFSGASFTCSNYPKVEMGLVDLHGFAFQGD